jgi:hypothetical protein
MSEADYLQFSRERLRQSGNLADKVEITLSDEKEFTRQGTLDFVDNVVDRVERHHSCPRYRSKS